VALRRDAVPATMDDPARGSVGRLLLGVAREMRTLFDRDLLPLGITSQQAELMYWTYRAGEIGPNQLTRLLTTDNAGVTRLIDRLEAKRLVATRADPYDRRAVRVALTGAGRALIPRVRRVAEAQKRRLFAGFSAADEARLRQLLGRVLANARGDAT
jgi:DNA-binding MarR family transcriptional regulator